MFSAYPCTNTTVSSACRRARAGAPAAVGHGVQLVDLDVQRDAVVGHHRERLGAQRAERRGVADPAAGDDPAALDDAQAVPAAATPTAPAATPRTRRVVLTMVSSSRSAVEAATDPGHDLVGDRPARLGPLLGGGLAVVTRTEEGDRCAGLGQVAAQVDDDLVHADAAPDGAAYAVDRHLEHVAAVAGYAVAVPGRDETDGRGLVRDPGVAVGHALALARAWPARAARARPWRGAGRCRGGVGGGVEAVRRQPDRTRSNRLLGRRIAAAELARWRTSGRRPASRAT